MLKKNSGKAPAYQMYAKDWNEDGALLLCSYAAEGLWIRLSNASYEMPTKGVFVRRLNGLLVPMKVEEILNLVRRDMREKLRLFKELKDNEVIKQFKDEEHKGAFYVKRIYEDMKLRALRQAAGSKGGNPNLVKQNPNQTDRQGQAKSNNAANQKSTPSSSTSSSISNNKQSNVGDNDSINEGVNHKQKFISAAAIVFCADDFDKIKVEWNFPKNPKPLNRSDEISAMMRTLECFTQYGIGRDDLIGAIKNYQSYFNIPQGNRRDIHAWIYTDFIRSPNALPKFLNPFDIDRYKIMAETKPTPQPRGSDGLTAAEQAKKRAEDNAAKKL